ncbi:MAG: cell division ATP-binding protein FtsE [Zymomonas mobilis subsp. pomaceae]|uniref:cell division ATP-binding protein FtsE n=1 Tax=Zymomonas mobilis TaxID=542 RepID=UPI0039E8594F
MTAVVQFDHVNFAYQAGSEILSDLNFSLFSGQFYFVTGSSGVGKTTLLKMIYLALHPYRGIIRLFGEDVVALPHRYIPAFRQRMGIVFQDFRLIPDLNVFDNIALPLRLDQKGKNFITTSVNRLLLPMGLENKSTAFPDSLSRGEQQRVAIARALIRRPEILVADEPTGNIDTKISNSVLHLLSALNKQGMTVIMATHNLDLLTRVPKAIHFHLENGQIVESMALLDYRNTLL